MRTPDGVAGRALADDVLRYWLAAARLEEALKTRPRARRSQNTSTTPRLDHPAPGQEYCKWPIDELSPLLFERSAITRSFDGELSAFFESWLYAQYRRNEDDDATHLLCFPVVHLAMGELAGLLRCNVRLRFSHDAQSFRIPTRSERQRNVYPAPPTTASLSSVTRAQGSWPFFIDTRLLSYPLGLSSEEIDALFEALRTREEVSELEMLDIVSAALEQAAQAADVIAENGPRASDQPPLARLRSAIQRLLQQNRARAEVYPVAIVIDGKQAKTTWHLQRELLSLVEGEHDSWRSDSCLAAYLTGRPLRSGETSQRSLFPGPALTGPQRRAAEHFWGSPLTSVQGPPGTGKTTLIIHLAAEALVRQVDALVDHKIMGSDLFLITSSNNRAVDNVLDPLNAEGELPLALRVGSKQVCEQLLASQLRRAGAFLQRAQREPQPLRTQALERAISAYRAQRAALQAVLAPRREALARNEQRETTNKALRALRKLDARSEAATSRSGSLTHEQVRELEPLLSKVELRLGALSALCEGKASMAQVNAIARHYEHTATHDLTALEAALHGTQLTLDPALPPLTTPLQVEALIEAWEEGAELFLARVAALREQLEPIVQQHSRTRETEKLEAELAALGAEETVPALADHEALSRALFLAARELREAWARAQAAPLLEAVQTASAIVEEERSLRPLFRDHPERAEQLCRLFGTWGSTLLSLGNCLPSDAQSVARVVIDEAGQCHPAHAVSALMRCDAAMIIGDVHQLPPVLDLTVDDEARVIRQLRMKTTEAQLASYRVSEGSHASAQSLAERSARVRHTLTDHYRCQPEIIAISDALCAYGLTVHTPSNALAFAELLPHPVALLDLRGAQERHLGSLCNELELTETLRFVQLLLAGGARPSDIAIVTPYRGQLQRLRRLLTDHGVPLEHNSELSEGDGPATTSAHGLALGTVHRLQGGERNIVLFSSVVTRVNALSFLDTRPNLLNVAISRARHHFVCLGDADVLSQGRLTRLLVQAAKPLQRARSRA